jgi:nitroreductase
MPGQSEGAASLRDEFARLVAFRHACKDFDESRPVSPNDLSFILEAGRMAPSSLGLEPWRFLVIEDNALRRRLRPACWNQSQVVTSSALIVIQALKADLAPTSDYPRRMLGRLVDTPAELDEAMEIYRQIAHGDLVGWSVAQCHIAAAQMMLAAAAIGIDTCPMGGFEPAAVAEVLGIDRMRVEIALLVAVGYRVHAQPQHRRLMTKEIVQYR